MKLLRRIVVGLVALVAIAYVGAGAYLYFNQRSFQYSPEGPIIPLADTKLTSARDMAFPVGDSVVNGWFQPPQAGKPLIIFYKGNTGSFTEEHERYEAFVADGFGFAAFDYPGFPASPGEISQETMIAASLAVYDQMATLNYPIVIWGRSIGTGPSTYVASVRAAKALLLETPFLSAVNVAFERYPFLPVALVMKDQFPVDRWILNVQEPVLIAHGTADKTIDVSNGERLYQLVPNRDELWIEPGADHSDLWARGIWSHAKPFFERAVAQP
jgi:fermentation-respiration switch protein FrsA (DUF1100 family)